MKTGQELENYQNWWGSQNDATRKYLNANYGSNEYGINGKDAPPPPDYQASADSDLLASRPNQTNAFGSSVNWTQNPDGSWSQNQSFGGLLGGLAGSLQGQAAQSMSQPMDWAQFGKVGTGDDAANQVYSQMTSRLNPQWEQSDQLLASKLANQGLDPQTSAAGRMAMLQQQQGKNDAYGAARSASFAQGQDMFRSNMMARQQAIAEALRARGLPMQELQGLAGFLGQPGLSGDPSSLQATAMFGNYMLGGMNAENQARADAINGAMGGLGAFAGGVGKLFGGK